jgi:hypothetical protein
VTHGTLVPVSAEEELASLGPGLGTSVIRFDFTP